MAEDVMLSFRSQALCPALSKDEIRNIAPMVFAPSKTNPETSDRYDYIGTEKLIDDMAKKGWYVTECKQQRANKRSKVRSFHTLAFQNPNLGIINEETGEVEAFPRIIVSNSHDGFHSFKFMAGLFRLVCSNGLILADAEFTSFSLRHINYSEENLYKIVAQSIELTKKKVTVINEMKEKRLSVSEQREFATKAIAIRKGVEVDKLKVSDEDLTDILEPVRDEDRDDSLWSVFNVLQEKVIKGDFTLGKTKTGKRRKSRPITGAAKDIDVNQGLFIAASEYLQAA